MPGAAATAREAGDAPVFAADFTEPDAAKTLASQVLSRCGPVDILIANAAIEIRSPWTEVSDTDVGRHVSANLLSLLALTQALVPPMAERGWGRVVATAASWPHGRARRRWPMPR